MESQFKRDKQINIIEEDSLERKSSLIIKKKKKEEGKRGDEKKEKGGLERMQPVDENTRGWKESWGAIIHRLSKVLKWGQGE